ncbi:MAG: hypothetical protein HYW49_09565 [Deltaproteobacteria bacterium]|nr:hypothetical protein [Deltaproteobacteria bacterium]
MAGCFKCGRELRAESDFGRQDSCPGCRTPTHCCLNCAYYDPSRYNECTEPVADRVVDKEKANFCDYFKPREGKTGPRKNPADAARAAAEALFRKK